MKILIIETSGNIPFLSVAEKNKIIFTYFLQPGAALSKSLGEEIKKILSIHSGPYEKIVLGSGPGSYTGIRVGAAIAQGLCFGWNIPLFTACSLLAFAPAETPYAVIADARGGGLYVLFNGKSAQKLKLEEASALLSSIPTIVSPDPESVQKRVPNLLIKSAKPDPFLLLNEAQNAPLENPPLLYLA